MALASLVLFDIDGTLLSIAERELNVFGTALEKVFGTAGPIDGYSFAGKTDHQITFDLLTAAGIKSAEVESRLPEMKRCYFSLLDEMLSSSSMSVLPGVVPLLDELRCDPSIVLGLQTGNWKTAADIKLERFGLAEYFEVGVFGEGQLDRTGMPPIAKARAEKLRDIEILGSRTAIIGDTTLDVACARTWGMASVGVATGSTSVSELRAAGAALVVSTLAELDARELLELISEEHA